MVDSILHPTRVIGVADGCGVLLEEAEEEKYQQMITGAKAIIVSKKLEKRTGPE